MARGRVFKRQGGYAFRVDLGPDPATGTRRQVQRQGFRTKREAETALDERLSSIRTGASISPSSAELGEFLDEWLQGQRARLKETTWESYRIVVERIKAKMGKVKLQALTPLDLERFYGVLGESGGHRGGPLAVKTVRNTHTVLRKALGDAERLGLVMRNPAASARPPADQPKEQKTWSSAELREFLEAIAADRLYGLYVLLATTGMRRGEALGLRWRDLDLDGAELHIVQTLAAINYKPVITTPKTKRSRRLIYLDGDTIAVLRAHRARQREERLAAGPAWDGEYDLVFCDELGGPLNPDWVSRDFRGQIRRAMVRDIRLHDLRHTYATLALKGGVHPKVVSDRLGHATVGITLDLYSHVTPAIGRDAADVVSSSVFG
jgi:integrase